MSSHGGGMDYEIQDEFLSVAAGKKAVEVHEVDPDGQFIKLYNGSDKDVSLGGWTLRQVDEGQEVVHKFPARGSNLKAHQYLTVWSHGRDNSLVEAHDITIRQNLLAGDNIRTILSDSKGEEMAVRQLRKDRVPSPAHGRSNRYERGSETRSTSSWKMGSSSLFSLFM